MSILFAAAEVGSFNAIYPCFDRLSKNYECFFFPTELAKKNCSSKTLLCSAIEDKNDIVNIILDRKISALIYSININKSEIYYLSKICKREGIPLIHILDYWNGYIERLSLNDEIIFPDYYLVPDEKAFEESIRNGIPSRIIQILGNPSFANYLKYYENLMTNAPPDSNKQNKLAFIAEPVLLDQGDESSKNYRGYTEYSVLKLLSDLLKKTSGITIDIFPHPRQNISDLEEFINNRNNPSLKINLKGSFLEKIMDYSGVMGMSSTVLYEAWLFGMRVISIQPNLKNHSLFESMNRDGITLITKTDDIEEKIRVWVEKTLKSTNKNVLKYRELGHHASSLDKIESIIVNL